MVDRSRARQTALGLRWIAARFGPQAKRHQHRGIERIQFQSAAQFVIGRSREISVIAADDRMHRHQTGIARLKLNRAREAAGGVGIPQPVGAAHAHRPPRGESTDGDHYHPAEQIQAGDLLSLRSFERLVEIVANVGKIFDSDGHPHIFGTHARRDLLVFV